MKLFKKLPKISKKTIVIASTLVLIVGIPAAYYLWASRQEDTRAWYDSNWMYRRAVQVNNPSSTVSNADVLVTVDTASLISAGKLQSDCDDLRFLDSDDSTTLSYWVESSCNTSNTQVWVRIPSLPSGGKTIYMYYGNPSAAKGQMAWSGNFILMSSTSCASGWTRNTSFDSRFPYGSSSYGTTGGSSSHGHGTFSKTTGGATNGYGCSDQDCGSTSLNQLSHTHLFSGTVASSTIWPPYTNTYFCSKSSLDIISGQIALYDSLPASNWTRNTAFDSRMPRGASSYGSTGGSTTHNHSLSGLSSSLGGAGKMYDYANCIGRAAYASRGDHAHIDFTGSSVGTANNTPPYRNMIFGQANSNMVGLASMITMATAQPPLGWNRYTNLDGRIPRGYSSSGSTGGTTTHTHSVTVTSPNVNVGGNNNPEPGGSNVTHYAHGHTVTFTSASANHEPPRLTTLFIQRKSSVSTSLTGTEEIYNQAPLSPTSPLTEGLIDPFNLTDTTPEFSAIFNDPDTGDTGVFYQIQVNTSSAFNGISMWDSGKTSISPIANGNRSSDISYNGTPLSLNGETYYWRIKFWDQNDINNESPWSAAAAFTMNGTPTEPTDLLTESSINPIKVYDTTPEFSAVFSDPDTGDTGIHYRIQVSTVSNFTSTVWDSNQTSISAISNGARSPDISYGGTPLALDGTLYYWRIKFWDQAGTESPWSSTATFRMSANPYAPIDLKVDGRTNPSLIDSARPTFYATHRDPNEDNAIFFEINVNSNASFSGTVKWNTGKVSISPVAHGTEFTVTYGGTQLLGNGTTYYWRIRFWDVDDNVSPWSATATFVDLFKYTRMNGIGLDGLRIN